MGKAWTKSQGIIIGLLLVMTASVAISYVTEFDDDVKLTTSGKGIMFETGSAGGYEVWLRPPEVEASYTIRLPASLSGAQGTFMTIADDGYTIAFMATAAYDGDIQSVWEDTAGDVGAMTAAAGDTMDAGSADSTIPWKVNTTAAPTTEGAAIWDSDDDSLKIGDGASTLTVAISGQAFHDNFSDFVANEHVDWTGTSEDFSTSGTLGAGAITGTSFIIGDDTLDTTEFGYLDGLDQAVRVNSNVTHGALSKGL
jgi:hypothetical protein